VVELVDTHVSGACVARREGSSPSFGTFTLHTSPSMKNFFGLILAISIVAGCNPCKGVGCANGGECNDGKCVCPPGYKGDDCNEVRIPVSVTIRQLDVLNFPAKNINGENWDEGGDAQISWLLRTNTDTLYLSPEAYENAVPGGTYKFILKQELTLAPESNYTIELFDFDSDGTSDDMGSLPFTPYNTTDGLTPSTIIVNGDRKVEIHLDYQW
jgi:hypothetical protein